MILQISESGEHTLPDVDEPDGGVIPVPSYIRPVLCKYRIEVNNLGPMVYMLNTKKRVTTLLTFLRRHIALLSSLADSCTNLCIA